MGRDPTPQLSFYRVCGLRFESDRTIEEFPPDLAGPPDVRLSWSAGQLPEVQIWLTQWGEDGNPWYRLGRTGHGYLLRFEKAATFWVADDGSEVLSRSEPGFPDYMSRSLFLSEVLPCLLSFHGIAVLHASAVRTQAGAIAFAGSSGHGKSTLAAHFASRGCPLITDDLLALRFGADRPVVLPAFPGVRLWSDTLEYLVPDSAQRPEWVQEGRKQRYGVRNELPFTQESAPLHRFYLLEPSWEGRFAIEKLSPGQFMRNLAVLQFPLGLDNYTEREGSFRIGENLVRSETCYRLQMPRDLGALPGHAARIAEHAGFDVS